MYIVFTKPNKFTKTYTEACQIAEECYNNQTKDFFDGMILVDANHLEVA